jgi:hypothetical protein
MTAARWLSVSIALVVAGCVQAQIADLRKRCDFTNDPRFATLRGKIPLSPIEAENPPTLAEISNNQRPTPSERAVLFELDGEASQCARDALNIASRMGSASTVGLLSETRLANVNLEKLLADGQITYGQYRSNSYRLLAHAQQILGEYERAQQIANAASRQAAAAQLSATTQALQAFNRQPSITTCNSLGNSISCISR